jgi:cytochrome P450 family 2 subfamily J
LRRYDDDFKKYRKLSLSILKQFGFGSCIMETRIKTEVEELVKYVRGLGGRPFNPHDILFSSVSNVILSVMFGRRFDRTDPKFQQLADDISHIVAGLLPVLDFCPPLRLLPGYRKIVKQHEESNWRVFQFHTACIDESLQVRNGITLSLNTS